MTSGENRPPGRRLAAAVITSAAPSAAASSRRAQLDEWKRLRATSGDKSGAAAGAASCDSTSGSRAAGGAAARATASSRPPPPPATGRVALPLAAPATEPQARAWSPVKVQARKEAPLKGASRMQPGRAATAAGLGAQAHEPFNSSRTGLQQQQQQQQQSSAPLFSPRKGPASADAPPPPLRPPAVPPLQLGAAAGGVVAGAGPFFPAAPAAPGASLSSARGPPPSAASSARPSATHGSELDARRGRQQLEWAHYLVQRHAACLLESMLLGERAEAGPVPVDELPLSNMRRAATPEEAAAQRLVLADGLIGMMQAAEEAMAALEAGPGTTLEGRAALAATTAEGLRAQSALAHWARVSACENPARV